MVAKMSKHGSCMVQDIGPFSSSLTPRWLSLENFRVLASLDVKVVQTYSKHDPGIDQDNWYYKDVPFNPCWLNLEVFVWSEQLRFDFQLHRAQKIVITQVVAGLVLNWVLSSISDRWQISKHGKSDKHETCNKCDDPQRHENYQKLYKCDKDKKCYKVNKHLKHITNMTITINMKKPWPYPS